MPVGVGLVAAFVAVDLALSLYKGRAWWDLASSSVPGLVILVFVLQAYRQRLECGEEWLRFRGGTPWPLNRLGSDWQVRWSEIRGARWMEDVAPAQLELDTPRGPRHLLAMQWQQDGAEAKRLRRAMAEMRRGRVPSFDATMLPLVRVLLAHGVEVPREIRAEDAGLGAFDLTANRATRYALLIAAFAAGFWFIDASVSSQVYGRNTPWTAIALVTAIIAIGFAAVQSRFGVPAAANLVVTTVLCASVALALYGGLQRLNQLTDPEAPRSVVYTLAADGTLVSNAAGVADLPPGFFGHRDFWTTQKPGSQHRFGYYKGLGFETFDVGEYRAKLKEHRARGRDRGEKERGP
jgi:hypothetical protein